MTSDTLHLYVIAIHYIEYDMTTYLLQRKCGLSKKCQVSDKQLDEAWVDLTILSQCKGRIQEGIEHRFTYTTSLSANAILGEEDGR